VTTNRRDIEVDQDFNAKKEFLLSKVNKKGAKYSYSSELDPVNTHENDASDDLHNESATSAQDQRKESRIANDDEDVDSEDAIEARLVLALRREASLRAISRSYGFIGNDSGEAQNRLSSFQFFGRRRISSMMTG